MRQGREGMGQLFQEPEDNVMLRKPDSGKKRCYGQVLKIDSFSNMRHILAIKVKFTGTQLPLIRPVVTEQPLVQVAPWVLLSHHFLCFHHSLIQCQ